MASISTSRIPGKNCGKERRIADDWSYPLLDYLPGDEMGNEVHLLGHSKGLGMAPIDGYVFYWN
jgi:hypothetical protein